MNMSVSSACDPRPPIQARAMLEQLEGKRSLLQRIRSTKAGELDNVAAYLRIADEVDKALKTLSEQLFGRMVKILEEKLTLALQEVLREFHRRIEGTY